MRRFFLGIAFYLTACVVAMVVILLRGDGPHPRVIALYPPNGDRYFPGGPAQITFSQTMDQASVERALQVSPGTQGQGSWFGETLNLQPVGDWKPGVTYHVVLTGTVVDDQGRPLRTPVSFWFRVHHVQRLAICNVKGVRNVCEPDGTVYRPITHSPQPVLQYALSPDGTILAYTRRDESGLPHLFLVNVDGTGSQQITRGRTYADARPAWASGDSTDVTYTRRPVVWTGSHPHLGPVESWDVQIDGTGNLRV